jgi:hypothetical protein
VARAETSQSQSQSQNNFIHLKEQFQDASLFSCLHVLAKVVCGHVKGFAMIIPTCSISPS